MMFALEMGIEPETTPPVSPRCDPGAWGGSPGRVRRKTHEIAAPRSGSIHFSSSTQEGSIMIRSILVPLDSSRFSEHALPLALSLARRAGAKLTLLHVHTPLTAVYL